MISPSPAPASKVPVFGTFDLIGIWEVPGSDSLQSGRLSYAKNDIILTVMAPTNAIAALQKMSDPTLETVDAIRGVIETGEHVFLDKCFGFYSQFIMNQSSPRPDHLGNKIPGGVSTIKKTTYRAKAMYVSNAPIPRRPLSTTLSVSYTSLFTWLNNYTIDTDIGEKSTTITFVPPKPRKVPLFDGLSLTLNYGHTISVGVPKKEFVLPQSASVIFESTSPVEMGEFHPHIVAFANFLMMGTKHSVQPEAYAMWHGKDSVVAFPEYLIHPSSAREDDVFEMHFNYQQIADSFDNVIRHWFVMSKKYEKSMNIYFQMRLVGNAQDSEIRFLRLAQALEAFYRAKHPDVKKIEISRMIGNVVSELPYDIFPSEEEKSFFISGVSNARNYFSHGFLPNKEQSTPKGVDLFKVTEKAEVLLYGCYLHELEIGDELKASIMKEKIRWANSIEFS